MKADHDRLLELAAGIDRCIEALRPGLSIPGDPAWTIEQANRQGALSSLHYLMEANAPTIAKALRALAQEPTT